MKRLLFSTIFALLSVAVSAQNQQSTPQDDKNKRPQAETPQQQPPPPPPPTQNETSNLSGATPKDKRVTTAATVKKGN